jgi:hypothetical protein
MSGLIAPLGYKVCPACNMGFDAQVPPKMPNAGQIAGPAGHPEKWEPVFGKKIMLKPMIRRKIIPLWLCHSFVLIMH